MYMMTKSSITEMESDAGFGTSPKPYINSFTIVYMVSWDGLDRSPLSTYSLWQTCLYAPFSVDLDQCLVPFVQWYLFVKPGVVVAVVVAVAEVVAAAAVVPCVCVIYTEEGQWRNDSTSTKILLCMNEYHPIA